MKASTKRALSALESQATAILSKLEDTLLESQEHLDELDPDDQKLEDAEEVVAALEDTIAHMEEVISSLESFV